jgi:hypothetical protein
MVRNDFTVTAATCAAVPGSRAGAVAPHDLVVVIAVRAVDASTLGERPPDVVDSLLVPAARVDDGQLAQVRAARDDARPVGDRKRLRVGDGARRGAVVVAVEAADLLV